MINLGLKLGSRDTRYTDELQRYYDEGVFQYIELFALSGSYDETISYWKQFNIPFGIHAPHSAAGLNLARSADREANKPKISETVRFADTLRAVYIIFHSGTNGQPGEVVRQLSPFADGRFLIENKPVRGLDGSTCVGCTCGDIRLIIDGIGNGCGFCLDFGHAVCAARTLGKVPMAFIGELMELHPRLYHLTDGDYASEFDSHLHYGEGSFPLKDLIAFVPDGGIVTNEAKRERADSLEEFCADSLFLRKQVDANTKSR